MGVQYLGDGTAVVPLGPGEDNAEGGGTTRVFRIPAEQVEQVDDSALLDAPPELHPDTGRPLSETAGPPAPAKTTAEIEAEIAALQAQLVKDDGTYTDNYDGTFTRDQDGAVGTFGPTGFVASA